MPRNRLLPLALAALTVLFAFALFRQVRAAVDLAYFGAAPQGDAAILVEWETATEFDNAGFLLARATDPDTANEDYTNISPFIPAEGSDVIGASYEFLDENVTAGTTYYYLLKAIDTSQNIEYHGPVSARIPLPGEATSTPTATATATTTDTPTPTATRTPTRRVSATPTRTSRPATATRTRIPTRTPRPATATLSPTPYTHTPTVTASPTLTPTATLVPPPAIVLTLPPTDTPVPQITKQAPVVAAPPTPAPGFWARTNTAGSAVTLGVLCLVVLAWGAAAVGIFILLTRKLLADE